MNHDIGYIIHDMDLNLKSLHNQRLNFLNYDFRKFWSQMAQNTISRGALKTEF